MTIGLLPGLDALRTREFAWEARGEAIHFDHASVGPLPQCARDAIDAFGVKRAEPHRLRAEDFNPILERARTLAAEMIGARASEIALTTNTSWGVNLAAYSLPLGPGDIVLGSQGEFPANVYPWMAAAKARGFTFELLPLAGSTPDEEAVLRRIEGDPRVKGVALSWVSFWSGARIDLERIGTACRARGIWFAVDAIQGIGAAKLDVRTMPVDMLACGAQKWLCSPWGSGFAYVREGLIASLEPPAAGWLAQASSGDFGAFLDYDPAWHEDARRFEVGTIPYQDIVGMNASLSLFLELGLEPVERHVRTLAERLVAWAGSTPGIRLLTPAEPARRAGIVSVVTSDVHADSKRLHAAHVTHSVREGAIRLAPSFHNTLDEVDCVIGALTR
jgi:selenocysteine lyase/cysteine desulfurase